jgi:hypothetical protein
MMPRDTNPAGTIFGGVILSYIDQSGAEGAIRAGAQRVVTVAMNEVEFHAPVFVGDLVSFYVELVRDRPNLGHGAGRGRGGPSVGPLRGCGGHRCQRSPTSTSTRRGGRCR